MAFVYFSCHRIRVIGIMDEIQIIKAISDDIVIHKMSNRPLRLFMSYPLTVLLDSEIVHIPYDGSSLRTFEGIKVIPYISDDLEYYISDKGGKFDEEYEWIRRP